MDEMFYNNFKLFLNPEPQDNTNTGRNTEVFEILCYPT